MIRLVFEEAKKRHTFGQLDIGDLFITVGGVLALRTGGLFYSLIFNGKGENTPCNMKVNDGCSGFCINTPLGPYTKQKVIDFLCGGEVEEGALTFSDVKQGEYFVSSSGYLLLKTGVKTAFALATGSGATYFTSFGEGLPTEFCLAEPVTRIIGKPDKIEF